MLYVELPKYRLHYQQYGSGPALIFLHGLSFDSRMWELQFEAFRSEYMTIGLDFRGHGFSDAPEIEYSMSTYVSDISALMNSLHLTSTVLIGLSLGGAVALEFALRYPQRVNALVLASSAMNGHKWSSAWKEVMRKVQEADTYQNLRGNLRQYWLRDPMFEGIRHKLEYSQLLQSMAASFSGKPIMLSGMESNGNASDHSAVSNIRCPVCVISGEEDRIDFKKIARTLAGKIHRAEWHQLQGVGHMVNLEAPSEFNNIVQSFLYRVDAGGI